MVAHNLHRCHPFHCSSEYMPVSYFQVHTSRVPISISYDAHFYPFRVSVSNWLHTYRSHGATRYIQAETKMSQKSGASTWWYVMTSKVLRRLSADIQITTAVRHQRFLVNGIQAKGRAPTEVRRETWQYRSSFPATLNGELQQGERILPVNPPGRGPITRIANLDQTSFPYIGQSRKRRVK